MDVLTKRHAALVFRKKPAHAGGALVVELDQQHGAVYTVVENAVGLVAANPSEVRLVKMAFDIGHLDAGVAVVHVADE